MNAQAPNMTGTVLVVDDDQDFLLQQQMWLEGEGFKVVTAYDSETARDVFDQTQPDLAVVDLMMEKVDAGFTLCHYIKRKNPDCPVILVTAVTSETGLEFDAATNEERSWVKADVVLAKPVRFEQLQREIERLLKG